MTQSEIKTFYERAKKSAEKHFQDNQINDYLNDLLIMNHFKKQLF